MTGLCSGDGFCKWPYERLDNGKATPAAAIVEIN
jgi:hypothetical protein